MKAVSLVLFLTTLLYYESYAQGILPPVYEVQSDTAIWTDLPYQYWQILEDREGKLTLEEVANSAVSNRFHDSLSKIDQNVNVYWFRYSLKNGKDRPIYISIDGNWEFADTYIRKSNKSLVHFKSGTLRSWDERNGLKSINIFPDTLNPSEEILIYQRLQTKIKGIPPNFGMGYYGTSANIKSYYIDYIDNERKNHYRSIHLQEAFLIGLLLLAMFINIYFYTITKEKAHLYFSLFALFLTINRFFNILTSFTFWHKPEWQDNVTWLSYAWAFIPLFLIQFFRHFLKINEHFPKWGKFLLGMGILNFLMMVMNPILQKVTFSFGFNYNLLPFFIIPICILITLFIFIKQKNHTVRLLILGAIPYISLMISAEVFRLVSKALMHNFRMFEVITLTWLVFFFTAILLMRFDELRKQNSAKQLENERLAKEKEIERNELIELQKIQLENEVSERTAELRKSLSDLKSTQSQLIQSEKMASLGELTAGIAHEIQNPLNFVNNFSEVSNELINELKDERSKDKDQRDERLEEDILNDIELNLEKINHHGKRASGIVKSMLEHSRKSTDEKESTDINALCDEYLRLAYHGFKAKDNSFNATIETHFDPNLPKVEVIPQDIGRVVLNLITNAFYAVNERSKKGEANYGPKVTVTTQLTANSQVLIAVKDNGTGIPDAIKDKIFQPFFTTKPTGQGTGLGLSLSYDIVKAHGGTLEVETREGEGTTFVVKLSI